MHHHTIKFKIKKYKDSDNTFPLSWQYEAYLNPTYVKKSIACVGPFDSLDELAKDLATRGGKEATYKFLPFTKSTKQIVQIDHKGKKHIESTISADELDELVDLFYQYKFETES